MKIIKTILTKPAIIVCGISFLSVLIYLIPALIFKGSNMPLGEVDNFFIWETAYRIALGQIPHQDFSSPVGVTLHLIPVFIYKLFSLYTQISIDRAFLIGQATNSLIALFIILWFTRGTHSIFARLLVIFSVISLIGSPARIMAELNLSLIFWQDIPFQATDFYRESCFLHTFKSGYFSMASGLLGLILFRLAYHPHHTHLMRERVDGLLIGALLIGLLFSKITHFVLGAPFGLVAYLLFRNNRHMMHVALVSFFSLLLILEINYQVVSGYFLDMLTLLQTRHVPFSWQFTIFERSLTGLIILMISMITMAATSYYYKNNALKKISYYMLPWPIIYILINHYGSGETISPFLTSLALYLLVLVDELPKIKIGKVIVIILLSLPVLARISVHLNAVYTTVRIVARNKTFIEKDIMKVNPTENPGCYFIPHTATLKTERERCWKDDIPWKTCWHNMQKNKPSISAVTYVQEGIRLIRQTEERKKTTIDKLLIFDATNPFNFLLNIRPPEGIPAWLDGITVSNRCRPSAEGLFADANYILVPEYASGPDSKLDLLRWYGDELTNYYQEIASSDYFQLYKKTKTIPQKIKRYACIPYIP